MNSTRASVLSRSAGSSPAVFPCRHSWLSRFKQKERLEALRRTQGNRYAEVEPRLFAGAYIPPLHAFSTGKPFINRLVRPLFALYASHLPDFVRTKIEAADLVTEMEMIKHPFRSGVKAQKGIEF